MIEEFKHKISVSVRFHEVDMLGVCNNAVYLNYFEHARLMYLKEVGLMPQNGIFSDGRLYFIVRNEINYRSHAFFDDALNVYTRIGYIKNSSFGFQHLIEKDSTKEIIVDGSGVVVHVVPETRKSAPLPGDFYSAVRKYESFVKIIKENNEENSL